MALSYRSNHPFSHPKPPDSYGNIPCIACGHISDCYITKSDISTCKHATSRPNASATHFNNNNREPSVTFVKTLRRATGSSLLLRLSWEIGPNLAVGNDAEESLLISLGLARYSWSRGNKQCPMAEGTNHRLQDLTKKPVRRSIRNSRRGSTPCRAINKSRISKAAPRVVCRDYCTYIDTAFIPFSERAASWTGAKLVLYVLHGGTAHSEGFRGGNTKEERKENEGEKIGGDASLEPEVTVSPNVPGFIPTGNSVVLSPAAHPSERTLDTLSLVTEEHSNLASPDRLASMPFWSHPNVLEFTLKGSSLGCGDQIGARGPVESARSSSTRVGAEKLRGMGVGKENSRVKWRRVRNSRAVALYDDGGFTRKSQCSATVLARLSSTYEDPEKQLHYPRVLPISPAYAIPILVVDSSRRVFGSRTMPINILRRSRSPRIMEVAAHGTAAGNGNGNGDGGGGATKTNKVAEATGITSRSCSNGQSNQLVGSVPDTLFITWSARTTVSKVLKQQSSREFGFDPPLPLPSLTSPSYYQFNPFNSLACLLGHFGRWSPSFRRTRGDASLPRARRNTHARVLITYDLRDASLCFETANRIFVARGRLSKLPYEGDVPEGEEVKGLIVTSDRCTTVTVPRDANQLKQSFRKDC
ncbi:hypothetical protein DBV15_06054 [Temnothorax longispinosus]|uniref:Uncharacterized protein n=1 Tax=Temnothorax longispinosus TaxID=300112 RepID=A0A4S2L5P4_9HYME|nr:hypothetical protein DBV15_06054 [Temnothorax longispinosus]